MKLIRIQLWMQAATTDLAYVMSPTPQPIEVAKRRHDILSPDSPNLRLKDNPALWILAAREGRDGYFCDRYHVSS